MSRRTPTSERGSRGRGKREEKPVARKIRFPAWAPDRRPDRFTLLLAALAALGTVLILARQVTYGVGLSADWAAYLSAAQSLSAGEGFVQIHGWPYLHWPPLYPMLLAAAGLFVFAPYDVAGPLNAAPVRDALSGSDFHGSGYRQAFGPDLGGGDQRCRSGGRRAVRRQIVGPA